MKRLFPMAAAMLCVAGTSATAQPRLDGTRSSDSMARISAAKFATCLIDTSGRSWRLALNEPFGAKSTNARYNRLMDPVCLEQVHPPTTVVSLVPSMSFPPYLLRSNLFDAMYRVDFARAPAVDSFEGVEAMIYPVADSADKDDAAAYLVTMVLGDCVARATPAGARTFLLTQVGTPAETAALTGIAPVFANCIPTGAELKLTRTKARAALAEPLYRLTQALTQARSKS